MHKASLLFIFEPCQGSKVRCLRSAPVRASFSCGYRPAPVDLLQMKLESEMHQPLEEVVHF